MRKCAVDEHRPTHLDLFSGIGGFALAAGWAGFRTIAFVERDPYCQRVLAKNWPNVACYSDIHNFSGRSLRPITLLTGGFPCQPFSCAGEQRGKDDDRFLWPEMVRVIRATEPHWVIGENVAGLDGLGLDDCISELEASGYEVAPPFEIPACAVGAPHRRNRIWIIAHRNTIRVENKKTHDRGSEHQSHNGIALWSGPLPSTEDQSWHREPTWFSREPGLARLVHGVRTRSQRLESSGNAIVPQVAYQILKAIREIEEASRPNPPILI